MRRACPVTAGEAFWQDLMSGAPRSEDARRVAHTDGRLLSAYDMDRDRETWERHPAGDEVLVLLSGSMTFLIETGARTSSVDLAAGDCCVVPAGAWHTTRVHQPSRLVAITAGKGTEHRPLQR